MHCRTTPAVNFKTKLRFRQHDPIMTQEYCLKLRHCEIGKIQNYITK